MLKIIILLLIAAAAVTAGPYLADSQGLVHIATNEYIIESSLTTAVLVLIASFIVLYVIIALLLKLTHLPGSTKRWFSRRSLNHAAAMQNAALTAMHEGNLAQALTLIKKSAPLNRLPAGILLTASECALQLKDEAQAVKFLEAAKQNDKKAAGAAAALTARLKLEQGHADEALQILKQAKLNPKLNDELCFKCYQQLGKLDEMHQLCVKLEHNGALTGPQSAQIEHDYLQQKLKHAGTKAEIQSFLKSLGRKDKESQPLMAGIAGRLAAVQDPEGAHKLLAPIIKSGPSAEVLEAIAAWTAPAPKVLADLKQFAAKDAITSEVNVPLLKALGNLELLEGKVQDAHDHLTKALDSAKSRDIYLKLAKIMEAEQSYEQAVQYYAKALTAED